MQFISDGLFPLTGYNPDELIGNHVMSFNDLIHPDDQDRVWNIIQSSLAHEAPYDLEYRMITKSGAILHVLDRGRLLRKGDSGKDILEGLITDITDKKIVEDKLKANEARLKEINATKDKFFSIIAHDLRSPFNSILGFSEMLRNQAKDLDINTIQQYAGLIFSAANQTMELLENLLAWARIQQDRIAFQPREFLLNNLVEEEIGALQAAADKKGILLFSEIYELIIVKADADMLRSVCRNLLSNAIKFTRKHGKVRISVKESQGEISISVSDNGIGLSSEAIGNLFKTETSFTTRGTENEKGTGLGLLLCKEFTDKHDGRISIESEPGKGSVFTVTIPAHPGNLVPAH